MEKVFIYTFIYIFIYYLYIFYLFIYIFIYYLYIFYLFIYIFREKVFIYLFINFGKKSNCPYLGLGAFSGPHPEKLLHDLCVLVRRVLLKTREFNTLHDFFGLV